MELAAARAGDGSASMGTWLAGGSVPCAVPASLEALGLGLAQEPEPQPGEVLLAEALAGRSGTGQPWPEPGRAWG